VFGVLGRSLLKVPCKHGRDMTGIQIPDEQLVSLTGVGSAELLERCRRCREALEVGSLGGEHAPTSVDVRVVVLVQ